MSDLVDQSRVLAALDHVRDPELDEAITSLGFVSSCSLTTADAGGVDVEVRLRLPTYFCAPNFAFLMVADAYDALVGVPGVRHATVVLDDHFASEAINGGIAARSGFVDSFPGLAAAELDDLRREFVTKAVMAGSDRVCRTLLADGHTVEELAGLRLGDAPESEDRERLRARRAELGLPSDDASPLLVDTATGGAVVEQGVSLHLRKARLTRVNIEANAGVCRGMLQHRYAAPGLAQKEEAR